MNTLFKNFFNKIEYFSDKYDDGAKKIFSITMIYLGIALINFYYFFVYSLNNCVEMATFAFSATLLISYSIYLTLFKEKYLQGQYIVTIVVAFYVLITTTFLGVNKDAYLVFYPLIFGFYSISPVDKKHINASALICGAFFILTIFVTLNTEAPYEHMFRHVEYVNILMAIGCTYFIIFTDDISNKVLQTVRNEEFNELEKAANTDFLTGLYNKRFIEEKIASNEVFENSFICMCDIDFFKKVNDTYGHATGDYVLKELADLMKTYFREYDLIIRWGGEEFMIIVKEIKDVYVLQKLDSLREYIKSKDFIYGKYKFNVSMTFGVKFLDNNIHFEENAKLADSALYYGKEHGRDSVIFYTKNEEYIDARDYSKKL
ncbi:MAG: GGDEF domain-containing protein [Lachnospirales bacterium]